VIRAGLLALLVLGYVLPGERVILQLTTLREKQAPLRVEATLVDGDPDWPSRVRFELHPEFGFRVSVENGGRWLVENGRVVAASDQKVPAWIPALGILVLKPEEALRAWLEWARIDIAVNQLARCGESDCFVVGGREAPRQLWIDKDRFEIQRWVAGRGNGIEFTGWTDWGGSLRFPARIRIVDRDETFAEFQIDRVVSDTNLSQADFTPDWVRIRPANPLNP
jgi:hypothetical protein